MLTQAWNFPEGVHLSLGASEADSDNARSPRHKSGVAMRFPRISRLRWDKPPREADRLETLERMLKSVTNN
jgi:ATP-dependent DNA ligase